MRFLPTSSASTGAHIPRYDCYVVTSVSVTLTRSCYTFSLLPDGDAAADGGLAGGLPGPGGSVHRGPELAALPLPRPPRAQRRLRVL